MNRLFIKLEHNMIEYLNSFKIFNYTVCFICYVMLIDGLRLGYIHSYFVKHNYGIDLKVWGVFWSFYLFLMLIGEPNHLTKCLSESKLLQGYGEYSYGVYLINVTAGFLNRDKLFGPSFNGILFISAFCYWFSFLFYHLIEKNMIKLANLIIYKFENSKYHLLPIDLIDNS